MNGFYETLRQLGPARLAIMGGVLVMLLMFFMYVSMRVTAPDMSLLYRDLSSNDSAAIAARLEESNIVYEISPDGGRVLVPDNEVGRARMLLAEDGLPNGGNMGYEIFDKQSGFGTTNFVQNLNQLRALEGELARTIREMGQVKTARVHLVLPQRELFSREDADASASVFVGLNSGSRLSSGQIAAIQSLVSSAVRSLSPDAVAIIDQDGTLLARGDAGPEAALTMRAEELRQSLEQTLTRRIEDLLGRTVGYGNVRATVTADLNYDRISTNEEIYDPEAQVARSIQTIEENSSEAAAEGNDIGVEANLPGLNQAEGGSSAQNSSSNRVEETTNFEISKTIRNVVRESPEIKKLSVAVVVDGTYLTDEEGNSTYQSRSDEELEKLESIVASAIGYDASRGDLIEVVNMPFAKVETIDEQIEEETLFGFEKSDLLDTAEIVTVAIMVVLVILLVLQPLIGRLLAMESSGGGVPSLTSGGERELLAARAMTPALAPPQQLSDSGENYSSSPPPEEEENNMIDMQRVEGRVRASSVRKVEDIVQGYPAETVSVLRSWMSQEG